MKQDLLNTERTTEEAERVFNSVPRKERLVRKFEEIPEEYLEGVLL